MNKRYINTKEDSMSIYLKDVRKNNTVNPTEELIIAKRISDGDESAIEDLVKANFKICYCGRKRLPKSRITFG